MADFDLKGAHQEKPPFQRAAVESVLKEGAIAAGLTAHGLAGEVEVWRAALAQAGQ